MKSLSLHQKNKNFKTYLRSFIMHNNYSVVQIVIEINYFMNVPLFVDGFQGQIQEQNS